MLVLQSLVFGSIICLVAFYAKFLWSRRRLYELAAKLPGPRGLPLIGLAHKLINKDFTEIFNYIMQTTAKFSSPAKLWIGPELVISAHSPESLQVVLNSQNCLDKTPFYDVLILTKGLVIGNGQLWRHHRKVLTPAFTSQVLRQLVPTFDNKSRIFVKNLECEVGKPDFDVFHYMSACSLETLLKGTMEIDRDVQSNPLGNDYLHHIEIASKIMMKKMLNILYHIPPIYRFTGLYQLEQTHVHKGALKIADEVYDEKLETINANCDNENENAEECKSKVFIHQLMKPQNEFSVEEIKDEINTLIAAGHETSALVTSHAILMLALHPDVQRKVVQELKEVYGSADEAIDNESLTKLVYLDMVIKETMRLFPVLPISGRKSTGEFVIGNYTIPAGATIIMNAFSVQRNKKYWGDDADQFRPERFEPESFKKVPTYAYIPFTGGPRICIGWRYGMLFMKTVLANFLRAYEISSSLKYEELEFEISLSMKIAQHCMISLVKRECVNVIHHVGALKAVVN